MHVTEEERRKLLETARGERPADLFIRGGAIANVYTGELLSGNVAVSDGLVAYVGRSEHAVGPQTRIIDADGMIVGPGYIEAHTHPWVLYNPVSLAEGILPLGTTTVVADNLFFYMQMGPEGFAAMADDLRKLPLTYLWVARLASQASFPGEAEMFALDKIRFLLERDDMVGTAEVTRWPALTAGDPTLLSGISAAESMGKISDGHTGGASEARLGEVVVSGIDADHEAITREEVLNRLRLGLWTNAAQQLAAPRPAGALARGDRGLGQHAAAHYDDRRSRPRVRGRARLRRWTTANRGRERCSADAGATDGNDKPGYAASARRTIGWHRPWEAG